MIARASATLCLALAAPSAPAFAGDMTVAVDATDIARRIVHTTVKIPLPAERRGGGPTPLYFIEWTPGNHNPSGPIQNVVDFRVTDADGAPVRWRRDETNVYRHLADVPAGSASISVRFSYITNQPGVNSRSSDTYGFAAFGGMNWNTVLVYPEWADKTTTIVDASLTLPAGWRAWLARSPRRATPWSTPRRASPRSLIHR